MHSAWVPTGVRVTFTRGLIKTIGLGSGVVTTTSCSEMSVACEGVQTVFFAFFAYLNRISFEDLSPLS